MNQLCGKTKPFTFVLNAPGSGRAVQASGHEATQPRQVDPCMGLIVSARGPEVDV